jgi:hypothetical protein
MDAKDGSHSPISPPQFVPSAEITPAEYEYYMRKARQMRTETIASIFAGLFAPLKRVFARAKPAPRRHEPVLIKRAA